MKNETYLLNWSSRQISEVSHQTGEETGLSCESVRKVLKLNKFYPYKLSIPQELGVVDPERRNEFREIMTNRIIAQPQLTKNIYREQHKQYPHVWARILDNVINENLNGKIYANMLYQRI